jgi:hypothetical protein
MGMFRELAPANGWFVVLKEGMRTFYLPLSCYAINEDGNVVGLISSTVAGNPHLVAASEAGQVLFYLPSQEEALRCVENYQRGILK